MANLLLYSSKQFRMMGKHGMPDVNGSLHGQNHTQDLSHRPHGLLLIRVVVELLQHVASLAPSLGKVYKRGRIE
jgi:hypothetical protein